MVAVMLAKLVVVVVNVAVVVVFAVAEVVATVLEGSMVGTMGVAVVEAMLSRGQEAAGEVM